MVEVVADQLIHDRVGEEAWKKAAAAVSAGMKGGVTGGGFVHAVEVCGAALAAHFPPTGPRLNAFPDDLREL
jgi:putative membrane protein